MSIGTWLDTAIGVALFFLAMSFLVSAVVEAISQVVALRATTLRDGIANLLNSAGLGASTGESASPHAPNFLTTIYSHSLMRGLYDSARPALATWSSNLGKGRLPSYVPSSVFASALLDVVTTNGPLSTARATLAAADAAIRNLRDAKPGQARNEALKDLNAGISNLEAAVATAIAEIGLAASRSLARLAARETALSAARAAAVAAGESVRAVTLDGLIRGCSADRGKLEAGARQWTDALDSAAATRTLGDRFAALRAALAAPHRGGDPVSWKSRLNAIEAAFKSLSEAISKPLDALAVASSDADRWLGNARDLVARIDIPQLQATLSTMVDNADATVADLRKAVASWFDTSMDRVSGWYKRKIQICNFAIALGLAVLINADAILITRTIRDSDALRAELVALAQTVDKEPDDKKRAQILQNQIDRFPIGWYVTECFKADPAGRATADKQACPAAALTASAAADAATVRIDRLASWSDIGSFWHWNWSPLSVLGWLITAFAVKLGAPFWFDLMSTLLKVRAAGNVPARSDAKTASTSGGAAP
ncbi:MAG: hypothetical protein JNK67_21700 [Alphaproteobacteria bacterium]|nr:hypothetical protein [Alphaproteobacteria bacterium]